MSQCVVVLWHRWLFARKGLGFIFDSHLTFSDQISSLSKSCYYHIRELRCIRPYLDLKTASTIATSIVHSKLDYCNSLYYNLPKSQTNRLQVIQNSLARAVVKAPKFCHVTPILKSLHCLKINERIKYKLHSLTYKAVTTAQPTYLHSLISVQPSPCYSLLICNVVTLSPPPTSSSLRMTNRSFRYVSSHRWNQLPVSFLQPCIKHPADDVTLSNSPPICSPLSPSITHSLFHFKLKTHLFHKSSPLQSASTHLDCLLGLYWTGLTLLNGFSILVIFLFFILGRAVD